jgi:hypothetical protein
MPIAQALRQGMKMLNSPLTGKQGVFWFFLLEYFKWVICPKSVEKSP